MNYEAIPGLEFGEDPPVLDPSVVAALPSGCEVLSTAQHGQSFWAYTGRIEVELADGQEKSFFIKVMSRMLGRDMIEGEFESMKAIQEVVTDFSPAVVAWGSYQTVPDTYFLLMEFRNMALVLPKPSDFAVQLAALHQYSKSPNGKFGFHLPTYPGNITQYTEWEDSWEVFFTKLIRQAFDRVLQAIGPYPENDDLVPILFEKVIPRLLRPLETEGRSIKPSLVHGDLWFANAAVDNDSGKPLIFDACAIYAHNECWFVLPVEFTILMWSR